MSKLEEKPGALFEAKVRDISADGRGILVHPSGRTYFVAGVCPNETIRARITQLKGRVGFAECVEVIIPNPSRVQPPCPYHGHSENACGGCPWQMLEYSAQLALKQQRIDIIFQKLNAERVVKPIVPSPDCFGYRNRAQFKTDGERLGFVANNSNRIVDIQKCMVLNTRAQELLDELRTQLPNPNWQPSKKKQWATLDIDDDMSLASLKPNQRRPFKQANEVQNDVIKTWLSDKLKTLSEVDEVLEFFSGSGNLTEVIVAQDFKKIWAVEVVAEAIEQLRARDWSAVHVIEVDLFTESGINTTLFKARAAQVLVLDPPRDGLKVCGEFFARKSRLKDVFYISCDLATLARDLQKFQDAGFKIKEAQPVDQFPHTPHIEMCVHLRRKGG